MSEFIYQDGKLKEKYTNKKALDFEISFNSMLQKIDLSNLFESKETKQIEEVKSAFNICDKVQVLTGRIIHKNYLESINLKGFTGFIEEYLIAIKLGMYEQNKEVIGYKVNINGLNIIFQGDELKLIEKSKTIEYRKDLLNVADDIDGCLLPDDVSYPKLIQGS